MYPIAIITLETAIPESSFTVISIKLVIHRIATKDIKSVKNVDLIQF
jgi:hypothetical protein